MKFNIKKKCDCYVIKFIVAGGITTSIDFICYIILSQYINLSISKIFSMLIAMMCSFYLNKYWTFAVREEKINNEKIRYFITQVINISLNVIVNQFVYSWYENKVVSFVVATLIATSVNYILQKNIVFRRK